MKWPWTEYGRWNWLCGEVARIQAKLDQIIQQGAQVMTTLQDLQNAEAAIQTAIGNAITLIQNLQSGSVADADVEAVVAQLNAASAALNAATGATGATGPAGP